MLHVGMDNDVKQKAVDRAFPLELKVPNAGTRAAMVAAEEILKAGRTRFAAAEDMFADLEETRGP